MSFLVFFDASLVLQGAFRVYRVKIFGYCMHNIQTFVFRKNNRQSDNMQLPLVLHLTALRCPNTISILP